MKKLLFSVLALGLIAQGCTEDEELTTAEKFVGTYKITNIVTTPDSLNFYPFSEWDDCAKDDVYTFTAASEGASNGTYSVDVKVICEEGETDDTGEWEITTGNTLALDGEEFGEVSVMDNSLVVTQTGVDDDYTPPVTITTVYTFTRQ